MFETKKLRQYISNTAKDFLAVFHQLKRTNLDVAGEKDNNVTWNELYHIYVLRNNTKGFKNTPTREEFTASFLFETGFAWIDNHSNSRDIVIFIITMYKVTKGGPDHYQKKLTSNFWLKSMMMPDTAPMQRFHTTNVNKSRPNKLRKSKQDSSQIYKTKKHGSPSTSQIKTFKVPFL